MLQRHVKTWPAGLRDLTILAIAGDGKGAARDEGGSQYPAGPPLPLLEPLLRQTEFSSWPSHLPDVRTQLDLHVTFL